MCNTFHCHSSMHRPNFVSVGLVVKAFNFQPLSFRFISSSRYFDLYNRIVSLAVTLKVQLKTEYLNLYGIITAIIMWSINLSWHLYSKKRHILMIKQGRLILKVIYTLNCDNSWRTIRNQLELCVFLPGYRFHSIIHSQTYSKNEYARTSKSYCEHILSVVS